MELESVLLLVGGLFIAACLGMIGAVIRNWLNRMSHTAELARRLGHESRKRRGR